MGIETLWSFGLVALLFVLLFGGLWVAFSLMGVAIAALLIFGDPATLGLVMATSAWSESASWTLTSLPLFIWMGEILLRTRLSQDLFHGLAPWLGRLPGGLLHVNVAGSAIFAAVSGSSTATCATVGKISLRELDGRGYPQGLTIGSLAASGTLGLLIPPSIIMIVYGSAAEVSISRLFIAGLIPGLIIASLFSGYLMLLGLIFPHRFPIPTERYTLWEKIKTGRRMIPVVLLIVLIIGSIYGGIATPTEAATFGVLGSLGLSAIFGSLDWEGFRRSLVSATVTSCMIAFILAGAAFLTIAMGFAGIPRAVAEGLTAMDLSPYMFLVGLTLIFLIMGCFLDGISMVLLTVAVILPAVRALGFDPIWFGVYLVVVVEMSMLTPPVGFNLFVLQAMTGRDLFSIARATLPFFVLLLVGVVLLAAFPSIATYLPSQM